MPKGKQERYSSSVRTARPSMDVGAGKLARTKANAFETVKNMGLEYLTKKAVTRGTTSAGLAKFTKTDGLTDTPEFNDSENPIGIVERQAHNNALRDSYVSSLDADVQVKMSALAQKYQHDITGFNDASKELQETVLENADPLARNLIKDSSNRAIATGRRQVAKSQYDYEQKVSEGQMKADYLTFDILAQRAAREGDTEAVEENIAKMIVVGSNLVDAGMISIDENFSNHRKVMVETHEQTLKNDLFDMLDDPAQGEGAVNKKLLELERVRPPNYTPDEWDKTVRSLRTSVSNRKSEQEFKEEAIGEDLFISLLRKANDQDLTLLEVTDPRIKDEEMVSELSTIYRRQKTNQLAKDKYDERITYRDNQADIRNMEKEDKDKEDTGTVLMSDAYFDGSLNTDLIEDTPNIDKRLWLNRFNSKEAYEKKIVKGLAKDTLVKEFRANLGTYDKKGAEQTKMWLDAGLDPQDGLATEIDANNKAQDEGVTFKKDEDYKAVLADMKSMGSDDKLYFVGGRKGKTKKRRAKLETQSIKNENNKLFRAELGRLMEFGEAEYAQNPEKKIDFSKYWNERKEQIDIENAKSGIRKAIERLFKKDEVAEPEPTGTVTPKEPTKVDVEAINKKYYDDLDEVDTPKGVAVDTAEKTARTITDEEVVKKGEKWIDTSVRGKWEKTPKYGSTEAEYVQKRTLYPNGSLRPEPYKNFTDPTMQGQEIGRIVRDVKMEFGYKEITDADLTNTIIKYGTEATMKQMQAIEAHIKKHGKLPPRK